MDLQRRKEHRLFNSHIIALLIAASALAEGVMGMIERRGFALLLAGKTAAKRLVLERWLLKGQGVALLCALHAGTDRSMMGRGEGGSCIHVDTSFFLMGTSYELVPIVSFF